MSYPLHRWNRCVFYSSNRMDHRTLLGRGCLTPLHRCNRCVFYSSSRMDHGTLLGRGLVTLLHRCNRCVIYSSSRMDHRTLLGRGWLPLCTAAICIYSTVPANWAIGHSLVGDVLPLCTDAIGVYSTAPADWTTGHSLVGCNRCVFYRSSQMDHRTLLGRWGGLTLLHSSNRCVFYSSSQIDHRTLLGRGFLTPLHNRCTFCSPNGLGHVIFRLNSLRVAFVFVFRR